MKSRSEKVEALAKALYNTNGPGANWDSPAVGGRQAWIDKASQTLTNLRAGGLEIVDA